MADNASYSLSEEALSGIQAWRDAGHHVVFTNGVFDVLHVGHVTMLEEASARGDRLIVGVNSDESVRRLGKGPDRPVNGERNRARLLSALRCVDMVVIFGQDTPLELIEMIRPNVLVKGGDYDPTCTDAHDPTYMVGSAEVKKWGGTAVAIPLVPGESTTATLQRIRKG